MMGVLDTQQGRACMSAQRWACGGAAEGRRVLEMLCRGFVGRAEQLLGLSIDQIVDELRRMAASPPPAQPAHTEAP